MVSRERRRTPAERGHGTRLPNEVKPRKGTEMSDKFEIGEVVWSKTCKVYGVVAAIMPGTGHYLIQNATLDVTHSGENIVIWFDEAAKAIGKEVWSTRLGKTVTISDVDYQTHVSLNVEILYELGPIHGWYSEETILFKGEPVYEGKPVTATEIQERAAQAGINERARMNLSESFWPALNHVAANMQAIPKGMERKVTTPEEALRRSMWELENEVGAERSNYKFSGAKITKVEPAEIELRNQLEADLGTGKFGAASVHQILLEDPLRYIELLARARNEQLAEENSNA